MSGSGFFSALFPKQNGPASNPGEVNNDLVLVKLTLKGDNSAFEQLVSKYTRLVRAVGSSFLKNQTDTDDFVQDVFVKVFTHLSSFRGDARFSTWITTIARNTALNTLSRRKDYVCIGDSFEIEDTGLTPEEKHLQEVTKIAIRDAMNELPGKYKECLDMYFYYDMPYNDISEATGIPVNTIKSNVFRAKKLLYERLKEML